MQWMKMDCSTQLGQNFCSEANPKYSFTNVMVHDFNCNVQVWVYIYRLQYFGIALFHEANHWAYWMQSCCIWKACGFPQHSNHCSRLVGWTWFCSQEFWCEDCFDEHLHCINNDIDTAKLSGTTRQFVWVAEETILVWMGASFQSKSRKRRQQILSGHQLCQTVFHVAAGENLGIH